MALTFMENNIFVFWADPDINSTMSENRKKCYQSLIENSGCNITLINKNNFFDYEVPGSEIHKGFKYLSDVHKSDYARGYLMYHHGGGYTDIKQCDFSWTEYFDQLKNSDADFISYAERREQDCSYYLAKPNYFNIGGNGMFIFKKQTVTGKAWRDGVEEIMDRIYTTCDEDLSFYFKQWATQNGYLYKSEQNWYNTQQFEQVGQKKQTIKLELKLKNSTFRYYPYMDTFKFQDSETGYLYNYLIDHPRMRTLCSSEGNRYEHNYLRSDGVDNVLRHQGDCNWVDYMGFYTHCNNVQWSDINDQYILCNHVKHDNVINDYIFNEEFDRFNNKERIDFRKKEIEEYNQQRKDRLKAKESGSVSDIISRLTTAQSVADLSPEDIAELYGQLRNVNTEQTDSFSW